MNELLERINHHLEFLMDCTIEPSDVRASTQELVDEIRLVLGKPKSNGDKIRRMTDEELARFLDKTSGCSICFLDAMAGECAGFISSIDCIANKIKWLQQEVSDDAGTD